ncbi:MAG: hypothetical protein IKJ92_09645 [Bacteroidaceae bacterium]|nr:hypothetical protein [Bacteroidaceae bacterium]
MSLRGNQLFGHKGTNKRAKYKNNFLFFFSERKYFLGVAIKVRISEQNIKIIFYFFSVPTRNERRFSDELRASLLTTTAGLSAPRSAVYRFKEYFLGVAIKVRISEQNMKPLFCFPDDSVWLLPRLFFKKEWFFRPAFGQKCQKIGQFSSKKAFFRFFLAIVLARVSNFAKQIGTKEFMPTHMRKNESVQPINRENKAKNSRNRGCVMKYQWIRDEISANI